MMFPNKLFNFGQVVSNDRKEKRTFMASCSEMQRPLELKFGKLPKESTEHGFDFKKVPLFPMICMILFHNAHQTNALQ